MLKGWQG